MIEVTNIDVWGFEHAIRGMRNPMNSWDKSDSGEKYWCTALGPDEKPHYCNNCSYDMCHPYEGDPVYVIGQNDLDLMRRLYKSGTEHRKYLRQIFVSMDITAPLYWWKEFDTYKFILPDPLHYDSNSCSTMHKIHSKEFEIDDFSHEHLMDTTSNATNSLKCLNSVIYCLNYHRSQYLSTKDKKYWWQLIQLLPSSYNQKRTITMNYENAVTIIKQRNNHKLDEWREFVKILLDLPYIEEIMTDGIKT